MVTKINPQKVQEHLKRIIKISVVFFVLLVGIQYGPSLYKNVSKEVYAFTVQFFTQKKILVLGETTVRVEVVDTPEKRTLGLSGREKLAQGTGMLFVFETEDIYGIWMKDMNFPLDIIWFNEYGEVIYFVENATPDSYPKTFLPPTPSLYVLEVPTGFVEEHHIKVGDIFDFY